MYYYLTTFFIYLKNKLNFFQKFFRDIKMNYTET